MSNEPVSTGQVGFNWKNIAIAFLFLFLVVAAFIALTLQSNTPNKETTNMDNNLTNPPNINVSSAVSPAVSDKLQIVDETVGTGIVATNGKRVTVNYVGTLTNGKKFDSSYDRNEPFSFTLGAGEVIKGWDEGVLGMKIGGKRKLTIPPSLGYGSRDMGTIPANSTLVFEVELLKVE
jgi:peptidylprolyl isomerase